VLPLGNITFVDRQHSVSDSGSLTLVLPVSDTLCLECVSTLTVTVCQHRVSPLPSLVSRDTVVALYSTLMSLAGQLSLCPFGDNTLFVLDCMLMMELFSLSFVRRFIGGLVPK